MSGIYKMGKRLLYGDQQMNEEILVKRQIFLDSIDDLFGTIEGHLSYENSVRNEVKNSIHKKALFNNELLKRVDSLMTTLQIFSLSCFMVKSDDDTDTLKLGKMACKQKLDGMIKHDRKKYKAFVDIMYYALDGNRIAFPKRQPTQGELNPNFNSKNMNDVLGQLIGGQHVVNTNRKKYKANTKDLKQKYDLDLKKAKNLPRITKVQLPEMDELYQVFNIKDQQFVSRKQKSKENKKHLNIKNGFIKSGNYSWKFDDYQRINLETPFPCLILEDVFSNDNKILVQLAYPYNYEFRPYKKDVFWCEDEEAKKKIIAVELKHFEKFFYLSLANKSYKSIADPIDIDGAIARYWQNHENNKNAPDVDAMHNSNNYNKNGNASCSDDYKDPIIDDTKDFIQSNASKTLKKKDNVSDNFDDDDNKDCSSNTTKTGHDMDVHGQHNHDNCRQHNVAKTGNNSDKHVKPDVDKIHYDENIEQDIDMMGNGNNTNSVQKAIPIIRHKNNNDSDGDTNMSNHQRTPSDQLYDKYNIIKLDINTFPV